MALILNMIIDLIFGFILARCGGLSVSETWFTVLCSTRSFLAIFKSAKYSFPPLLLIEGYVECESNA